MASKKSSSPVAKGLAATSAALSLGKPAKGKVFGSPLYSKRVSQQVVQLNMARTPVKKVKPRGQENVTPPDNGISASAASPSSSSPNGVTVPASLKKFISSRSPSRSSPRSQQLPPGGGDLGVQDSETASLRQQLAETKAQLERTRLRHELAEARKAIHALNEGQGEGRGASARTVRREAAIASAEEQGNLDHRSSGQLRTLLGSSSSKVGGTPRGSSFSPTRARLPGASLTESEIQATILKKQQEEVTKKDATEVRKAMSSMQGAWRLFAERGYFDVSAPSPDGVGPPVPLPNYPFYTFLWLSLMAIATSPQYSWPVAAQYYHLLMKRWTRKSALLEPQAADNLLRHLWGYGTYDGQVDSILRAADTYILAEAKATAGIHL